ncbi:MAG: TonB-dependent receptor [Bacteroidota bacterium]
MKKYSFIFLFALLQLTGFSQSEITQTIRGTVVDAQSKYPIIGATVQLIQNGDAVGTSTDVDGNFSLEDAPLGRNSILVSYIGYEEKVVPNILVSSGKETVLNIELEEKLTALDEVVVKANREQDAVNSMASGSVRLLSMEELMRFSGSFGDPARMAQNYAGVSSADDTRNDVIVRGNSPSSVLWRLEGIDVPSPNHWSTLGTTGGPISILNANNLSNSDFLSSAFPAEYGNATGAVFDLGLRNGNSEQHEFLGQVGFNGFEAGFEGPLSIGKNASFIANARYSTLGVFKALGIDFGTGSAVPEYTDGTFKINIPTENAGRFSIWGIGGVSDISFGDEEDNTYSVGSSQLNTGARTGILGLTHLYFFDDKTSSKFSFAVSDAYSYAESLEVMDSTTLLLEPEFISNNRQTKYAINWSINKKINAKNRVKTGVLFDLYDLYVQDSVLLNNNIWFTETDFIGQTSLARAYGQWQHRFNEKLTLNAGLHAAWFLLNDSYSVEPRFGLNYKANDKHRFNLGFGRHSQLQPLPVYFSKWSRGTEEQNQMNEELGFTFSNHYVLGWDYSISAGFRMKLEAYYQSLSGIAVDSEPSSFSVINQGADFGFSNRVGLVNEGTGSNIGFELTLEKSLQQGFYFLATASIFDSKYKGSDGIERNTFFNSNYVTNLLIGKEFRFNERFSLTADARVNYAGGRRYTPFDLAASKAAGRGILEREREFEAQYGDYARFDFKIGIRHNAPKFSQIWSIDLVNLTGRQNEFQKSYSARTETIRTSYQRGFFPNVLYQILF